MALRGVPLHGIDPENRIFLKSRFSGLPLWDYCTIPARKICRNGAICRSSGSSFARAYPVAIIAARAALNRPNGERPLCKKARR
jgi:hypothetical protein